MLEVLRQFGPTIEAGGGIDEIDPNRLGELMSFVILREQENRRQHEELFAAMSATGI